MISALGATLAKDVPLKQGTTHHSKILHYPYILLFLSHELLKMMTLDTGFEEVVDELVDIET